MNTADFISVKGKGRAYLIEQDNGLLEPKSFAWQVYCACTGNQIGKTESVEKAEQIINNHLHTFC